MYLSRLIKTETEKQNRNLIKIKNKNVQLKYCRQIYKIKVSYE